MHQLQQLNRELNITQPAGAELYLLFHLRWGDIVGHTGAHRLHRLNEGLPRR